jgi:hypothetical protein
MNRLRFVVVLFVVSQLLVSTGGEGLVIKSSAFDDFLARYGRRSALEINDINDITRNLLEKFGCESYGTTDCFNVCLQLDY